MANKRGRRKGGSFKKGSRAAKIAGKKGGRRRRAVVLAVALSRLLGGRVYVHRRDGTVEGTL